jgi:hypothetical protein
LFFYALHNKHMHRKSNDQSQSAELSAGWCGQCDVSKGEGNCSSCLNAEKTTSRKEKTGTLRPGHQDDSTKHPPHDTGFRLTPPN